MRLLKWRLSCIRRLSCITLLTGKVKLLLTRSNRSPTKAPELGKGEGSFILRPVLLFTRHLIKKTQYQSLTFLQSKRVAFAKRLCGLTKCKQRKRILRWLLSYARWALNFSMNYQSLLLSLQTLQTLQILCYIQLISILSRVLHIPIDPYTSLSVDGCRSLVPILLEEVNHYIAWANEIFYRDLVLISFSGLRKLIVTPRLSLYFVEYSCRP